MNSSIVNVLFIFKISKYIWGFDCCPTRPTYSRSWFVEKQSSLLVWRNARLNKFLKKSTNAIFWRSQRETHDFSFGVWLVPKRAEQAPSRTARQDALLNLAQRFHKFSNSDKMNTCWENVMSTPLRSAFAHITSYIIYNVLQYVI